MHAVFVEADGQEVAAVVLGAPRARIVRCPLSRRRFVFIQGAAVVHVRRRAGPCQAKPLPLRTKLVEPGRLRVEVPYKGPVQLAHASCEHASAALVARERVHVGSLIALVLVAAFEMTVVSATRW
jgi:hypothetical protein